MKGTALERTDWQNIETFVEPGTKVLDLGCGDGSLLEYLIAKKNIIARGVDINEHFILECIQKGISVFQSDLDEGLSDYGDNSFDYVILSLTLQVVYEPQMLLKEMLRVGKKVIVSIPNFGHWTIRGYFFFTGRTPKTKHLPYEWYNTPNIRTITVSDFIHLCKEMHITLEQKAQTTLFPNPVSLAMAQFMPNLFSRICVFLLSTTKRSAGAPGGSSHVVNG